MSPPYSLVGRPAIRLAAVLPAAVAACSYFEVKGPEDVWVIGRTMELGMGGGRRLTAEGSTGLPEAPWEVVVHPRGEKAGPQVSRFGFAGLDFPSQPLWTSTDGMNEVGLSISAHTMRTAEYEHAEANATVLNMIDVVPWILGHFDSVAAVEAALADVRVVGTGVDQEDFLHWAIADARGESAVLEYVGGRRFLHRNDVRVMTNDPDYTWHLKNLNMYVGLTPEVSNANVAISVATEVGNVPRQWSQGFNLLGLPGDFSPASRFVRLFYLRAYALLRDPVATLDDAIVLATGLLNNVFIPRGSVAPMAPASSVAAYDFTQYSLLKIPSRLRLLFRGYRDMVWQQVDLSRVDWTKRRSIPVSDGTLGIKDVTRGLEALVVEHV